MLVGYARVSTVDQDTALQLDALHRAGVRKIFQDKGSGVGPRPNLHRAIGSLRSGDTFIVWKMDRIARSLSDLLSIIERVKETGASVRSLTEPIDTSSAIGELALQMLGAFAQFERRLIRERALAGQVAAWERGVRWGGTAKVLTPEDESEVFALYGTGCYSVAMLADMFGCSVATINRALWRQRNPGKRLRPVAPVLGQYLQ